MKKILLIILLLIAIFALLVVVLSVAGGPLSDSTTIWNEQRPIVEGPERLALTPGVFTGTDSNGFYGDVSVAITVDENGLITDIEVVYSNETPSFADPAFAHLIDAVLAAQSPEVDVFTNATISSVAFLNAVNDAMRQSGGAGSDAAEAGVEETPSIAGTVFTGVDEGGYKGDIVVAVTLADDGTITHIEVLAHEETPGIANPAFAQMISAMLETQSADVDIVTDATVTSVAFIAAVRDALQQAP